MDISEARSLIEPALAVKGSRSAWADLGCGTGLFTQALAGLLQKESVIYAVDKNFQNLPAVSNGVAIHFQQLDFTASSLTYSDLDGILMANSLHYVDDKKALLRTLKQNLKTGSKIIIIEYERRHGNQWVPFPILFRDLKALLAELGFGNVTKVGERKSAFGNYGMYAIVGILIR